MLTPDALAALRTWLAEEGSPASRVAGAEFGEAVPAAGTDCSSFGGTFSVRRVTLENGSEYAS